MADTEKNTPADEKKPATETPKADAPKADAPKTDAAPAAPTTPAPSNNDNNRGGFNRGGQGGQGGGFNRGGQGGGRGGNRNFDNEDKDQLHEKVVFINRCSKVVKGGRRFSFSALVVVGDQEGKVGYGFGKANEVAECIKKAVELAKVDMTTIKLTDVGSIPHEVYAEYGGGKVLLKPASPGTGVICGGGMRAVCEAAGVKNVLGKSLGSNNHANVVKATLKALASLRTKDEVMAVRGRKKAEKAI